MNDLDDTRGLTHSQSMENNSELESFILSETKEVFNFLGQYSFSAPRFHIDQQIHMVTITFVGENLAIEIIFDKREQHLECKIARVTNGKVASEYAFDENRRKVREDLASILRQRGIREKLFRNVSKLELKEQIRITLEDFASMLKIHGEHILKDSPEALSPFD